MTCPDDQQRYLNTFVYPVLMDGVYEVAKHEPEDPVLSLAQWLWRNNPNRPNVCLFPIHLIDEIEAMKKECRHWQMQRGIISEIYLSEGERSAGEHSSYNGNKTHGMPVIREMDEGEESHVPVRCAIFH